MDKIVKRPLFSIIIPIYKVEQYLEECVESVLNQNFLNYEIILVDDGSPDRCPMICDKYVEVDSRIHVIHKENGGSSSARNSGVEAAIGEYVIFLDSDDYWNDNGALDEIAAKIKKIGKVDVLVFNNIDYSCITGKSIKCNRSYDSAFLENSNNEEALEYIFENNLFPGAAWVTVTRRNFLKENKITFIEGIKAEDIDWLLNVFLNAERISAVNNAFYVYRKYRNGSITGTADSKSIEDILYTLKIWISKLNKNNYKVEKKLILGFLYKHYLCAVLLYDGLIQNQKKYYKVKLEEYNFLLKYSSSLVINIFSYMPIGFLSKWLKLYQKWRRF